LLLFACTEWLVSTSGPVPRERDLFQETLDWQAIAH
jgi:hypothetical protein